RAPTAKVLSIRPMAAALCITLDDLATGFPEHAPGQVRVRARGERDGPYTCQVFSGAVAGRQDAVTGVRRPVWAWHQARTCAASHANPSGSVKSGPAPAPMTIR